MTNEQLVELIQMDIDTKENLEKLYTQNITMLKTLCKPYSHAEPMEDLLQQSFFGVVESVKHYDADRGYKWLTYARYYVLQSIRRYIQTSGQLIRIPPHMNDLLFRYRRFLANYETDHATSPDDETIQDVLDITSKQLKELKKYLLYDNLQSLDCPVGSEADDISLIDCVEADENMSERVIDNVYQQELKSDLEAAMKLSLTKAEQNLVKDYYWNGGTLASLAQKRNVTRGRVRHQLITARNKMTRGKAGKILKEYAKISCVRRCGSFAFFKNHGSVVEYELIRREEIFDSFQR